MRNCCASACVCLRIHVSSPKHLPSRQADPADCDLSEPIVRQGLAARRQGLRAPRGRRGRLPPRRRRRQRQRRRLSRLSARRQQQQGHRGLEASVAGPSSDPGAELRLVRRGMLSSEQMRQGCAAWPGPSARHHAAGPATRIIAVGIGRGLQWTARSCRLWIASEAGCWPSYTMFQQNCAVMQANPLSHGSS